MKKRSIFVGQARATTTMQKPAKASTAAGQKKDPAAEKQIIDGYRKKLQEVILTGKKLDKAVRILELWINEGSTSHKKGSKKAA